jgi:hypothetical protein
MNEFALPLMVVLDSRYLDCSDQVDVDSTVFLTRYRVVVGPKSDPNRVLGIDCELSLPTTRQLVAPLGRQAGHISKAIGSLKEREPSSNFPATNFAKRTSEQLISRAKPFKLFALEGDIHLPHAPEFS